MSLVVHYCNNVCLAMFRDLLNDSALLTISAKTMLCFIRGETAETEWGAVFGAEEP